MNPRFFRLAVVAPLLFAFVGSACRSATDLAPAPVFDPAPRFTCVSSDAAVDAPRAIQGSNRPVSVCLMTIGPSLRARLPGGFAGIYLENGKLVVNFVDPEAGKAALTEISQSSPVGPTDKTLWDRPDLRSVRWSFAQLYDWSYYTLSLHQFAGVTATDIDEKRNALLYGFLDETARNAFIEAMNAAKVPCNLVLTEIRLPAMLASRN